MTEITAYIPRVEELEDDDLDEVYSDWSNAVNMTADELRRWSSNPCSRQASEDPTAVIRRNLRLLETPKDEWDTDDIADAKRTISFIERMSADDNKPESPRDGAHSCPADWAISLLNWAHNPFESLPEHSDELDDVDEVTLSSSRETVPVAILEEEIEEGDYVDYGNEDWGLVFAKHTENFEFPGGEDPDSDMVEVIATEHKPVYVIGKAEGGTEPMVSSDITKVDRSAIFDPEDPDPEEDLDEIDEEEMGFDDSEENANYNYDVGELNQRTAQSIPGVTRTQRGQSPWPRSWRQSDKPARLIALDAYQSMGMSHTGCTRSMRGKIARVNAFCAAFKDGVLGYKTWREGGG